MNLLRLRIDRDFVRFGTPDDLAMFERIQDGDLHAVIDACRANPGPHYGVLSAPCAAAT